MDCNRILISNGLIINWGIGETGKDITMPITFPNIKAVESAIHIGTNTTVNIISRKERYHDKVISCFTTNNADLYVLIAWIAIGY